MNTQSIEKASVRTMLLTNRPSKTISSLYENLLFTGHSEGFFRSTFPMDCVPIECFSFGQGQKFTFGCWRWNRVILHFILGRFWSLQIHSWFRQLHIFLELCHSQFTAISPPDQSKDSSVERELTSNPKILQLTFCLSLSRSRLKLSLS